MHHPILGDIEQEPDSGDGIADVPFEGRIIKFRITSDEISFDETLEVAASVVNELAKLDTLAKQVAASELTDTYNDGWSEYEESQKDGALKPVSNPELTQE